MPSNVKVQGRGRIAEYGVALQEERERVYLIPYQVQSLVSDKEDTLSNGDRVMLAREKHDGHAGG